MSDFTGKKALVTGASRGIGASVSRQLAARGADVAINFRSKGPRAEGVAREVEACGREALLAQADMTDAASMAAMMEQVARSWGQLDVLVLNASGGLEKDRPANYAMDLNLTSQVRCVDLALPLLRPDARIVFVTSHLAHFYGRSPVPEMYEPVAASKKAGEMALMERLPEFSAAGISLVMVSGDMIEGTITPKLMERAQRGAIEERRRQAGTLPTVDEFAAAIVEAAGDASLPSGHVVFVGSTD